VHPFPNGLFGVDIAIDAIGVALGMLVWLRLRER